jgi:hypothetical protein
VLYLWRLSPTVNFAVIEYADFPNALSLVRIFPPGPEAAFDLDPHGCIKTRYQATLLKIPSNGIVGRNSGGSMERAAPSAPSSSIPLRTLRFAVIPRMQQMTPPRPRSATALNRADDRAVAARAWPSVVAGQQMQQQCVRLLACVAAKLQILVKRHIPISADLFRRQDYRHCFNPQSFVLGTHHLQPPWRAILQPIPVATTVLRYYSHVLARTSSLQHSFVLAAKAVPAMSAHM